MIFKKAKALVCILMAMLILVFAIGCSQGDVQDSSTNTDGEAVDTNDNDTEDNTTEPGTADEDIKISMTWWGDTARNEVYNQVIDLFEQANTNIKVDRPFGTWDAYWDKLATQIAGGSAPDVISMHQRYVSDYALRGALHDLQPFVDSGALNLDDFPESVINAGYVNGVLCMVTQGITGTANAYNTSTFDNLGVEYPDMDWTWDDYVEKLKEIKGAADAKGIEIYPSTDYSTDFYNFSYWARTNGQNLFTEQGEIGFTEDSVLSWFQFWKELRDEGLIPDAPTVTEYTGLPLEQNMFATGLAAITGIPASQVGLYQELVEDDGKIVLIRFPHSEGPGKMDPEYLSGSFFAVNAKSEHPEAAAKLIDFFINNTEGQKTFRLEQGVPGSTKAIEAIFDDLSDAERISLDYIQNQLVKYSSPEPYPPIGYNEIGSEFNNVALAVAFGEKTPEDAAAEFIETCERILSQAR